MLKLADDYTEADHDRALQRLADDIDAQDTPAVRDNHGEPIDLGQPWTRRDIAEFVVFVLLLTGSAAMILWGVGR